ncbi:MAG: MdtA/MuxA family multidrug efflux RND transporter periplasmic adaptor subunit [Bryobacteraceae bacterium]
MGPRTPVIPEHTNAPLSPDGHPTPAPPAKKRRSFAGVWLLLLCAIGYGAYYFYHGAQQKQQAAATAQNARTANRPVSVVSGTVRTGLIPVYLRGLGTITPFNTVTVKSRVDGQLIAIHFTEGQTVKQDQLLAEIDPRPFQVQLQQAEGQLAKDKAQLADAQVNLSRYEALWNEKVIAKQQLDTQKASVGQFEGVIESDQAAISNANLQLTYAKVTAPITGRIGLRLVDVGNIVHAADPNGLAVIEQLQPITVLFTIPADNLPPVLKKLHAGAKLPVEAYDRDDRNKLASGYLLTVDNQIDPTTGTSRLKAVFSNADAALFPNQFVNCRLLLETKPNAVIVSAPAIQRGPQGNFVYLINPGKTVSMRPVTLGTTEGDDVEIVNGLQGDETVVMEGQDKLQDGSKVDVRTPGQQKSGGHKPRV